MITAYPNILIFTSDHVPSRTSLNYAYLAISVDPKTNIGTIVKNRMGGSGGEISSATIIDLVKQALNFEPNPSDFP